MASFHTEVFCKVSPERLLELLATCEYLEARARFQNALHVEIKEVERTAQTVQFWIRKTEYSRTIKGVNRDKTEEAEEFRTWDLKERRCSWTIYYRTQEDRVQVNGINQILPDGEGCRYVTDGTIEVKLPLIGTGIALDIAHRIEEKNDKFQKFIDTYLQEHEEE